MQPNTGLVRPDAPTELLVESPAFQGSLALLFQCVREGKVSIADVPLTPICRAYVEYLVQHAERDFDAVAGALTLLAYLIERKAWMLLPVDDEPEPEPIEDFEPEVEPWASAFGPAIEALTERHEQRTQLFFRQAEGGSAPYETPFELGEVTAQDLASALGRLLAKATPQPLDETRSPRRSLADQMAVVLLALGPDPRPLEALVPEPFTRTEAVWWFLALLELIRLGQAKPLLDEGEVKFHRVSG